VEILTIEHDKLLLSRLQLFRNVDMDNVALLDLLGQCEYQQLAAGEVILSTEAENYYLYILLKGRLVIQLNSHDDIPLVTV
jgi:hypothetical protein